MLIRIHQTQNFKTFTYTSSLNCNKRGLYSFGPTLLKPESALRKKDKRNANWSCLTTCSFFLVTTFSQNNAKTFCFLSYTHFFCLSSPVFFLLILLDIYSWICVSPWDVSLKFQGIVKVSWRKLAGQEWEGKQDLHWNFLTGQLYIA